MLYEVITPLVRNGTDPLDLDLTVKYQGCAEIGVCYPPITREFKLSLPGISEAQASESATATPAAVPKTAASVSQEPLSELDQIADTLRGGSTLVVVGVFFLLGLGLARNNFV